MLNMTKCIVVARYNEDVRWTRQFPKVVIYNKGSDLLYKYNEVKLNNVGREGHSYYKYICDNYESLDDYIIFLQGHPFDHSPSIIRKLHHYLNNRKLDIHFNFLSDLVWDCNLSGCTHHPGLPLIETYEKLFNERKDNMPFKFGNGALFIVSKKLIHKKPKSFYEKIVKLLEYDVNPIEGYVIERFHKLIFCNFN